MKNTRVTRKRKKKTEWLKGGVWTARETPPPRPKEATAENQGVGLERVRADGSNPGL